MRSVSNLGIALTLTVFFGCTPSGSGLESDSTHYGTSAEKSPKETADAAPAKTSADGADAPAHGMVHPPIEGDSPHGEGGAALSQTIDLGGPTMTAPESFKPKKPASGMISQEFSAQPAEGDPRPGRMTVMAAGGSVEANVTRWKGQFKQPDGSSTDDHSKVEKKTIGGHEVHVVDISGTYADSPGMMAQAVDRPDYRMLAAILPIDGRTYFVKFYGPKKTVTEREKDFAAMLDSLK